MANVAKPDASGLLDALPEALRPLLRRLRLNRGEMLFHRGEAPCVLYFVLSGEVTLVRYAVDGSEIVLQRARGGPLAEASLDHPAYHCDAIASRASVAAALPLASMRAALTDQRFQAKWHSHILAELRRARARAERLKLNTVRERILHAIETEGKHGVLYLPVGKKAFASDIGVSHEALYRTLARLVAVGEIAVAPGEIRVTSLAATHKSLTNPANAGLSPQFGKKP